MHWGEWLAWFAPRKIDEWKKLLVAWAIDLFGGATEAESANLDPPRAKIGKLGIGDTLNRLQANKYKGLEESISKVARRVARFLRPLRALNAFTSLTTCALL